MVGLGDQESGMESHLKNSRAACSAPLHSVLAQIWTNHEAREYRCRTMYIRQPFRWPIKLDLAKGRAVVALVTPG